MKKIVSALLVSFMAQVHAQEKQPIITDVSVGPLVFFNSEYNKATIWDNNVYWGGDVCIDTRYGYHMFVYTIANTLSVWNGLYVNRAKTADAYVFYIGDLAAGEGYTGLGAEYSMSAGKLDCLPFVQLGVNTKESYRATVSIGILFAVSKKIWDREARSAKKHTQAQ